MKRVLASVQAAATLNKLYDGSPVSLTAISKESKLSTSYLEQIFKKLRAGNLVISQRGPGGGYSPRGDDITVTEVITAVSPIKLLSLSCERLTTFAYHSCCGAIRQPHKAQNPRKAG
ncbi:Rrf2 family transcriptional regulator [Klebsiella variicola subsp. variicola]|nr:Rrf2 family transcriptional regulator [Klebsiella variicola subsp. variicola]